MCVIYAQICHGWRLFRRTAAATNPSAPAWPAQMPLAHRRDAAPTHL